MSNIHYREELLVRVNEITFTGDMMVALIF